MLRLTVVISILLVLASCAEKTDSYLIKGKVEGYNNEYLFMMDDNNHLRDSVLVYNEEFEFKGTVASPTAVYFATSAPSSASARNVYIENQEIELSLKIEKKERGEDFTFDWIEVVEIKGSNIDSTYTDYMNSLSSGIDYSKLRKIIKNNPNNNLSGDLLFETSLIPTASKQKLIELFSYINWEAQEFSRYVRIKGNLFPEENLTVGKKILDFELDDRIGNSVSTQDFRGSIILIEFWASWCAPCREAFPELSKTYLKYKDKGFEIIGVSIDDSQERWLKAIDAHDLEWTNIISKGGNESNIVNDYEILEIPMNYLVDEQGIILAKDISVATLDQILPELLE
ncbi:redoxin domain-containing protein [Spongiimicrobium salis]|uniref:redoxin domain-containing protein n=1 Tax=Spongiimicrobium salis TaxID=1667022 RepID=UPI00374CC003